MAIVNSVQADIDGDGQKETVLADDAPGVGVEVIKGGVEIWHQADWIDGWAIRPWDIWTVVDIDSDGAAEIVLANNRDLYTGVMKWVNGAMHVPWGSPSPLTGPGGTWNRAANDQFTAGLYGTQPAVVLENSGQQCACVWASAGLSVAVIQYLRPPNPLVLPLQYQGQFSPWVATVNAAGLHLDGTVVAGVGVIVNPPFEIQDYYMEHETYTGFLGAFPPGVQEHLFDGQSPDGNWLVNPSYIGTTPPRSGDLALELWWR